MRFLLFLLSLAIVTSCAQHLAPTPPVAGRPRTVSTIPINTAPGDTVLVFQRTPCFGTCPAYTATIFRSGKVSYTGERFVPVLGQHTLQLDPLAVQAMLDEARRINFNGLAHSYRANVSDLPATLITTYLPGQQRYQVMAEGGTAPQPLKDYINYLQARLDPLAGIGVDK